MQLPGYPDVKFPDTLGELLLACRVLRGLSRAELAGKMGVKAISIAKYEKAGSPSGQNPPIQKLVKLAMVLEIDPRLIFASASGNDEEAKALLEMNYQKLLDDFQTYANTLSETMKEMFYTPGKFADMLRGHTPVLASGSPEEAAMQMVKEIVTPENMRPILEHLKAALDSPMFEETKPTKELQNKENPREDLPSPSGSNPKTPHVKKESDDGQPSD